MELSYDQFLQPDLYTQTLSWVYKTELGLLMRFRL